ncbi:GcvT family protein [Halomicrococcus gelatinilyticus]|uniref:GcvT family protein n=1 Tax=Halomicrococcus gelatinilyticus TaxID=1702103 RepID=UPI002E167A49
MSSGRTPPDETEVLIVGAGIVGCSTAYHLAERGREDVTVVDQGPIPETGGSTVHAPGGLVQTSASKLMSEFAQYSQELYTDLGGFDADGLLELVSSPERLDQARRLADYGRSWGVRGGEVLSPEEATDLNPLVDEGEILGAYYSPDDGLMRTVELLEALADRARSGGATFHEHTTVTDVETENGAVQTVVTDRGRIACDELLVASNIWAPLFGEMADVDVPLVPCEHQYVVTESLPELEGADEEAHLTGLRYQEASLYFRQHGEGYGVGSYNHAPRLVDPHDLPDLQEAPESTPVYDYFVGKEQDRDPIRMMANQPFREDDFDDAWEDARRLIPALSGAEVDRSFNGVFAFTPDGMPLVGQPESVDGLWIAAAVWLTHAGGVGRAMAEWMDEGYPRTNLLGADVNRFQEHAGSRRYGWDRSAYAYDTVYDLVHPREPATANRGLRTGPFYDRQTALDAEFYAAAGWERARWYGANEGLLDAYGDQIPERSGWEAQFWSPVEAAEHLAVRDGVGLFDLSNFTNVDVTGPGALDFVQRVCTNAMAIDVGDARYTLLCTERGGILGDATVVRLAEERYHVLANSGAAGTEQLAWLRERAPDDGSVTVTADVSGRCAVGVWGPDAREMLAPLVEADLSNDAFPYFTGQDTYLEEVPVTALRVSYVGELGWELHTGTEYGRKLWEYLQEAGAEYDAVAMGDGALDTMRLEKGYPLVGVDISPEYDPFEAGLDFAVDMDTEFVGREALQAVADEGPNRTRTAVTLDAPDAVVFNGAPVFVDDETVGYAASADYGYSVGRGIVSSYLPVEHADPGTSVVVQYENERYPATVREEPLFDPGRDRLLR